MRYLAYAAAFLCALCGSEAAKALDLSADVGILTENVTVEVIGSVGKKPAMSWREAKRYYPKAACSGFKYQIVKRVSEYDEHNIQARLYPNPLHLGQVIAKRCPFRSIVRLPMTAWESAQREWQTSGLGFRNAVVDMFDTLDKLVNEKQPELDLPK